MSRRLSKADWVAAVAAALGILVAFLPWYSYTQGPSHITVNGFRASIAGDVFFLAAAATGLLLLSRAGVASDVLGRRMSSRSAFAAAAGIAAFCALIQLVLVVGAHRSAAPGVLLALLVAVGMAAAAGLRGGERQTTRMLF